MTTTTISTEALLRKLSAPRRNNYYYGKMMDVRQFETEQRHVLQKRSLLNRLTKGTGVLAGLGVVLHDGALVVECGVALDCLGREVIVPTPVVVDPWKLTDACGGSPSELSKQRAHVVTLSVCYEECLTDWAPVLVSDCDGKEDALPGTVVETFRLRIEQGKRAAPAPVLPPECCKGLLAPALPAPLDAKFAVVATLPMEGRPVAVATSPDGRFALVVSDAQFVPPVTLIDIATNQTTAFSNDVLRSPIGGISFAPDEGPAFVSFVGGLVQVLPQRGTGTSPVLRWRTIIDNQSYGRCAAALGGRLVYAINLQKKSIDIINTQSKRIMGSLESGDPIDLAVSPDNRWLSVLRGSDGAVETYDIIDPQSPPSHSPKPDLVGVTLAARVSEAPESYVAMGNQVRVLGPGSVRKLEDGELKAIDTAFTSNGRIYYAVSSQPQALAIFEAETLRELARLPAGENPVAVAVVPNRLRAFIANAGSGDVTVVDGRFERSPAEGTPMCGCARGTACEVEPCCVPLAHIELLPGGRIGEIDSCTPRTPILSNQALLELIVCLARRIDECCGRDDLPPLDPDPPEQQIRITTVQFLGVEGDVLLDLADAEPQRSIKLRSSSVRSIRVQFSADVDHATITTTGPGEDPRRASFNVTATEQQLSSIIPGRITPEGARATRWTLDQAGQSALATGRYLLTLLGDADTSVGRSGIQSTSGSHLDAELTQLPTGDAVPGGTFKLEITIVDPENRS